MTTIERGLGVPGCTVGNGVSSLSREYEGNSQSSSTSRIDKSTDHSTLEACLRSLDDSTTPIIQDLSGYVVKKESQLHRRSDSLFNQQTRVSPREEVCPEDSLTGGSRSQPIQHTITRSPEDDGSESTSSATKPLVYKIRLTKKSKSEPRTSPVSSSRVIHMGQRKPRTSASQASSPIPRKSMSDASADLLAFLRLQHAHELGRLSQEGNETSTATEGTGNITAFGNLIEGASYEESDTGDDSERFVVYNDPEDFMDMPKPAVPVTKKSSRGGDVLCGPCVVCEAPKAGFHFGAVACAACSAFFRRTVAERRKYSCRKVGEDHMNCPIDKHHRCYCRACRLQKCLAQGMDPMSVQPHRDSIGAKMAYSTKRPSNVSSPVVSESGMAGTEKRQRISDDQLKMSKMELGQDEMTMERTSSSGSSPAPSQSITTASLAEQLLAFSRNAVISSQQQKSSDGSLLSGNVTVEGLIIPKQEPDTDQFDNSCASDVPTTTDTAEPSNSSTKRKRVVSPPDARSPLPVCDPNYDPQHNMIERMVVEYRNVLERRRIMYCPSTIRDILSGTLPVSKPSKFPSRVRMNIRVEIGFYVEFLNSVHPFPKLTIDDKVALMKHLSVSFSILEKYYNTMRAGGLQTNRLYHADGSYMDLDDPDSIEYDMNELNNKKMDRGTFKTLFVAPLRETLQELCGSMFHSGTTDVEFCALVAILLFDPSAPGLSEKTRRLVKDARDRVYCDWFAFYAAHGIEEGSQRIGNTMLLLPTLQSAVEKTAENYHLIRIFELFDYDKILDDVYGLSID